MHGKESQSGFGVIKRSFNTIDEITVTMQSVVRLHLEYANAIW